MFEAERLVPLLLDDAEPAVRKLAIRASSPVSGLPQVQAALDRVAAADPVERLRDLVAQLPGREPGQSSGPNPRPEEPTRKVPSMPTDDEIVERAIAKFGPVLDLRTNPQALIDIVHAARVQVPDDGGLPPGGAPEPPPPPPPPPPGPTSMQVSEATLDDVMAEVLKLSRRLAETTTEIAQLRDRLG